MTLSDFESLVGDEKKGIRYCPNLFCMVTDINALSTSLKYVTYAKGTVSKIKIQIEFIESICPAFTFPSKVIHTPLNNKRIENSKISRNCCESYCEHKMILLILSIFPLRAYWGFSKVCI